MAVMSLAELDQIATPVLSANKAFNLGPFMVGTFVDSLLCGILLMQCGSYATFGKHDSKLFKGMVGYVLLVNLAITVFIWAWIFDLFVYNFGSYGMFLSIKYLSWFYVLDSAVVLVVQAFFGLRAWRLLDKNFVVGSLILALVLTAFGAGVGIKVMFTQFGSTLYAGSVRVPAYICLFCTVGADVIITGIILFYLWKNRGGVKSTDHLLTRLMTVTFSSQLPPTLIAIAVAIEYSIKFDSFIAIPFICVQGKVYAISLVHTLNVRELWRRPTITDGGSSTVTGDIQFRKPSQPTQSTVWRAATTTVTESHIHTRFEQSWHTAEDDMDDTASVDTNLEDETKTVKSQHSGAGDLESQTLPPKRPNVI